MLTICLTILIVVVVLAVLAHELVKDASSTRLVLAEKEREETRHREERARAERREHAEREERWSRERAQASARKAVAIPVGATVAVHIDGRVVQGLIDEDDDTRIVLSDASIVSGTQAQKLGGRQHFPHARITQIQELGAPVDPPASA